MERGNSGDKILYGEQVVVHPLAERLCCHVCHNLLARILSHPHGSLKAQVFIIEQAVPPILSLRKLNSTLIELFRVYTSSRCAHEARDRGCLLCGTSDRHFLSWSKGRRLTMKSSNNSCTCSSPNLLSSSELELPHLFSLSL